MNPNNTIEFPELLSRYLNKADVYIAKAMADSSSMIIKKRIELEMSKLEFASFMGVPESVVSEWESGDYDFTIELLATICAKLNTSLSIGLL